MLTVYSEKTPKEKRNENSIQNSILFDRSIKINCVLIVQQNIHIVQFNKYILSALECFCVLPDFT